MKNYWNSTFQQKKQEQEITELQKENEELQNTVNNLRRAIEMQCADGTFCDDECIFKEQCDVNASSFRGCSYTWEDGIKTGNFTLHMTEEELQNIRDIEPDSLIAEVIEDEAGNRIVRRGDGTLVEDDDERAGLLEQIN